VFELLGLWWSGQAPTTLWLAFFWVLLLVLARQVGSAELPRLRQTLWLLLIHVGLGLWAAAHSVSQDLGHQWALLGAQLLGVAIGVSLFNHLVLGILLGRFKRSVPTLLRDVLGLVVIVVSAVVLVAKHGFDVKALLPTGAVLTAVIGLALQQTLGNLIGGLSLQFDKSVRVGDWISVENLYGRVTEIRWRATSIETNDFETVVVPNAQLLAAKILVRGRRGGTDSAWRRWVRFRLPFSAPSAEVLRIAEACLAEPLEGVASWPPPNAVLLSLEDGVAVYALRYWLTRFEIDDKTDSAVRLRLLYHLRRAGFEPALPAQQLTLLEDGRAEREASAKQQQEDREEALRSMELFSQLQPEEIRQLARELRSQPFGPGEALCRQGESADSLYIVREGRVHVRVQSDGGEKEVAQLGPGSYFGEMGLMTGEPRTATVVAEGHVEALRLQKEPFRRLLTQRPALAESIAEVLAQRKVELEAVRERLDQDARKRRQREHHNQMLGRIRDFFGHRA
jgi:small-conductance mechanosensitive channel/CRP-like cAMP-binding protein